MLVQESKIAGRGLNPKEKSIPALSTIHIQDDGWLSPAIMLQLTIFLNLSLGFYFENDSVYLYERAQILITFLKTELND